MLPHRWNPIAWPNNLRPGKGFCLRHRCRLHTWVQGVNYTAKAEIKARAADRVAVKEEARAESEAAALAALSGGGSATSHRCLVGCRQADDALQLPLLPVLIKSAESQDSVEWLT